MVTATDSLAIGINRIVRNFLCTHMGQDPKGVKTQMTEGLAVVFVRDVLPPAVKDMVEQKKITVESYQQLHRLLLKKSEHVLRTRVAGFLQRSIKGIRYIFGTLPEEMIIIIYLEPGVSAKKGVMNDGQNAGDRVQTV